MSGYKPEIGEECEYRPSQRGCWAKVTILGVNGNHVWCQYEKADEPYTNTGGEFRPLKTQADKEREAAIDEMWSEVNHLEKSSDICEALHNAGYRKVGEQATAEDIFNGVDDAYGTPHISFSKGMDVMFKHFNIYRKED